MGSLSARCSVVACANPTTGHYNRSRTILENIRDEPTYQAIVDEVDAELAKIREEYHARELASAGS